MIVSFGAGVLYGTRNDIANQTPFNFGKVQEVQMDVSYTTKMLYGQNQFPLDIARGQGKVTCKAKMAVISGNALGAFFMGAAAVAGQNAMQFGEAGTVPGVSTYTIQVSQHATFLEDLGVVYAATGLALTLVTTLTGTAGQYTITPGTGTYTFNSTDANAAVLITYRYTISATGNTYTQANQLLGFTPTFSARFMTVRNSKPINVSLHNCVASKYTFQTKLEDYTIPELDFDCFADAAGNIMDWSYAEVS